MNDSAEGRRMTIEIISWSISTKVWDRARIKLTTPGSAVRFAYVARHFGDFATRPVDKSCKMMFIARDKLKISGFSYLSVLTYFLGAQKNCLNLGAQKDCLNETVLFSTHKIVLIQKLEDSLQITHSYLGASDIEGDNSAKKNVRMRNRLHVKTWSPLMVHQKQEKHVQKKSPRSDSDQRLYVCFLK